MIKVGTYQKLKVVRFAEQGAYLGMDDDETTILLPKKQLTEGVKIDDEIEVFVYRDSKDRLISTTKKPYAQIGELAYLEVVENTKIGAFLDWGLEKDLFVPFKEQQYDMKSGKKYLVSLYEDKSGRLCATTSVYEDLSSESPYKKDDMVKGTVYKVKKGLGVMVAVDNKYRGLIPQNEYFNKIFAGEIIEARVIRVREDGKLDLSPRKVAHEQMGTDAEIIMNELMENGGFLSLNDKSAPEEIKSRFNMSKNSFKRAIGRLYKEKRINITEEGIKKL